MTSIDDLKHDLKGVSDTVLRDLDTEDRIRVFAKEAAEGNDERLEQLADTAPEYEYTAPDLEYLNGIKKLGAVSLQARHSLQTLYQLINKHKQTRDKLVALMLLNESLSRLSRGSFEIDEFGQFDAPDHDDARYAYDENFPPDVAYLGTKYRELWDDVPAEFLVDEDERAYGTQVFPDLGVNSLLAYPDDLSGEIYDDLDLDRMPSDVYEKEVDLLLAVVEFRTRFYGWRLFAEEHLGITFEEFLGVSSVEEHTDLEGAGAIEITEQLCENTLRIHGDYIGAYPALLEESAEIVEGADEESIPDREEIEVNLDDRAEGFAEGIADAVDLPGAASDA